MPKTVYYSAKAEAGEAGKTLEPTSKVAVKAAERSITKVGPVLMVSCLAIAILCVLLVPLLVGGAAPVSATAADSVQQKESRSVTTYETPELALAALGLTAKLPTALPEGYEITSAGVVDGTMLELGITSGRDELVFRTAAGTEDLAGMDYDRYSYTITDEVDGITRGYAGVSEKKLNLAVWVNGNCSYALVSENGVETEQMKLLAESIA